MSSDRILRLPAWGDMPRKTLIMGILNVTPDSFSNGGEHFDRNRAIDAACRMAEDGADIIDIGGESTRPGSRIVPHAEEQDRILPIIEALKNQTFWISVDTRNASTMRGAIDAGAHIINDVSGLGYDPASIATVASLACPVAIMHTRGTPETMTTLTAYDDVVADVMAELKTMVDRAIAGGVRPDNIAIDPGLGFAKDTDGNRKILQNLSRFGSFGHRIMIGASRKRFIGDIAGLPNAADRDAATLAAHLFALNEGASIIRIHNVPMTAQAMRVWHDLSD